MSVRISAVVCTHNRAAYLRKALQSLVDQTLAQEQYEIIVVDNASTDSTRQVVSGFSDVPNLCYLYEPIIGLSRARNRGWRSAQGEFIALLDDDAIACPQWLARYIDAFEAFGPGVGSIGGKVELIWETAKPDWLSVEMLGILSVYHYSSAPIVLNEQQWMSACNIAYPREVLQAAGGFREDLGRKGGKLLSSAEDALRKGLDSWGLRSIYDPNIVVGHHVSAARLTKSWFRNAAYWQGMSDAIMVRPTAKFLPFRVRMGQTFRKIGWSLPRLLLLLVGTNAAARFRRQCQVLEAFGYVSGLWRREVERA